MCFKNNQIKKEILEHLVRHKLLILVCWRLWFPWEWHMCDARARCSRGSWWCWVVLQPLHPVGCWLWTAQESSCNPWCSQDWSEVATFQCSFLTHLTMRGSLQLSDFVIPLEEEKVPFSFASGSAFNELVTGWQSLLTKHIVPTDLSQESLMVQELSRSQEASEILLGSQMTNGQPSLGTDTWCWMQWKHRLIRDVCQWRLYRCSATS